MKKQKKDFDECSSMIVDGKKYFCLEKILYQYNIEQDLVYFIDTLGDDFFMVKHSDWTFGKSLLYYPAESFLSLPEIVDAVFFPEFKTHECDEFIEEQEKCLVK